MQKSYCREVVSRPNRSEVDIIPQTQTVMHNTTSNYVGQFLGYCFLNFREHSKTSRCMYSDISCITLTMSGWCRPQTIRPNECAARVVVRPQRSRRQRIHNSNYGISLSIHIIRLVCSCLNGRVINWGIDTNNCLIC